MERYKKFWRAVDRFSAREIPKHGVGHRKDAMHSLGYELYAHSPAGTKISQRPVAHAAHGIASQSVLNLQKQRNLATAGNRIQERNR